MFPYRIRNTFFLFLLFIPCAVFSQEDPLVLWYKQPAARWTEALPIGNGRLGAMIYGGVEQDHIQFNEETLWTGRPRSHNRAGAVKYLDTIRTLLREGKQREAEELAGKHFMGLKDPDDSAYAKLRADYLGKVLPDKAPAAINFDDARWPIMQLPTPDGWEKTYQALDGVVWFRTSFDLPASWSGKDVVLNLGRIRDMDVTYLNGEEVGSSEGSNNKREYRLKASQLKPGKNYLAIQVINFYDKGGLTGNRGAEKPFYLYTAAGDTLALDSSWKFHIQTEGAPPFPRYEADYQPFGDLYITQVKPGDYTNYRRELDISKAIARTTFTIDGVRFTREYFASAPGDCIAIQITADKPGSIDYHVALAALHRNNSVLSIDSNTIALTLKVANGALNGSAYLFARASGGRLVVNEKRSLISVGADTLTLYLVAATNFRNYKDVSGNAAAKAAAYLQKIRNTGYASLRAAHIKDYQQQFNKFYFKLPVGDHASLPTDQRLRKFSIEKDPSLIRLYLQYGRYLLLSSSRTGTQPANLQGIWNDLLTPPWGSKYTTNINVEMNYWPSDQLNLSGCQEPLFKMITELAEAGKETAKEYYGAPGWVLHHNTDLWRATAPVNASNHGIWVTGGAWLCQHLWEHYLFTQDKDFLKKYYPVMREAARFFVHFLVKDPKTGWLISTPSNSPEQGGLVAGPAMDHQIIRALFRNCIEAAAILKTDARFADTLKNKLPHIAPDQVGRHGQLQEWLEDKDDINNRHRHVSHLWAAYPGTDITWKDSALMKAVRQSLIYRGDGGTGWSLAWKVNLWARLKDGDHTLKMIKALLEPAEDENGKARGGGAYNNLLDAHPPFQIDGNFGGAAGIAEMFMQSHEGDIELLPALPAALPAGTIRGMRARGGFELDIDWDRGKLLRVVVRSFAGNECQLRYKDRQVNFKTQKGGKYTYDGLLQAMRTVPDSTMNRIYNEIKTPHKYGLVLVPENSKMMDCPAVFRKGNSWYMTYIVFDGNGYETWLAKSDNLLQWKTLGKMMSFSSDTSEWDALQKAGYISLQDHTWNGSYAWQSWNNKYWMSYIGGNAKGYEAGLLSMGIAWTSKDPTVPHEWERVKAPVLSAGDKDVRWWENRKIFKSSIIWDKDKTTGYPFVVFYNANGDTAKNNVRTRWFERIGMAVSSDMLHWKRFGQDPVMHHPMGITGDAVVQKIGNVWVMFYFGAFWEGRKDAFNRFACSYDLVNWTDWTGPDLIAPSENYDQRYAHKPYIIKHNGVVYHFYCAVDEKDRRGIALATSVDMGKSNFAF